MSGTVLAVGGGSSPVGYYIATLVTIGLAVGGWFCKRLIARLDSLRDNSADQKNNLLVLTERVAPVLTQVDNHDKVIGETREKLGSLQGQVDALRDMFHKVLDLLDRA